jgi:hypothetical protein
MWEAVVVFSVLLGICAVAGLGLLAWDQLLNRRRPVLPDGVDIVAPQGWQDEACGLTVALDPLEGNLS